MLNVSKKMVWNERTIGNEEMLDVQRKSKNRVGK